MPLPDGGKILWPPAELGAVHRKLHEWSSWYSGDTDALASFYSGAAVSNSQTAQDFFSSDKPAGAGGPGNGPRTFWGAPLTPGTLRTKLHIPVASDIAEMSANLLFGEMPTFRSNDASTQKALDAFQTDGMHSALREAAERCAALGGIFLKVVWDADLSDRPWLVPVPPERAVPTWSWDRLRSVTFWDVLHQDKDVTLRLLECHEIGSISYGLYQGTPTELGTRIPLAAYEGTAHLAALYGEQERFATTLPWLTAAYIPNVRPARVWEGVRCAANLGRSDYAGVEPVMDQFDEAWTSWMRDLRLGKSRIIVPQSMLESDGPGKGARLDMEREAFIGMDGMLGNADGSSITMNQFAIRVTEHKATTDALFEQIVQSAGYSVTSFGGKGDVAAVTATEVVSRKEQSLSTRDQKILYWRPNLRPLLQALLGIDQVVFKHASKPEAAVDIDFPEGVQPTLKDLAETLTMMVTAQAMSIRLRVQMLHPTWTKAETEREVAQILAEQQAATPAPPAARPATEPAPAAPVAPAPAKAQQQ